MFYISLMAIILNIRLCVKLISTTDFADRKVPEGLAQINHRFCRLLWPQRSREDTERKKLKGFATYKKADRINTDLAATEQHRGQKTEDGRQETEWGEGKGKGQSAKTKINGLKAK